MINIFTHDLLFFTIKVLRYVKKRSAEEAYRLREYTGRQVVLKKWYVLKDEIGLY